MWPFNRKNKASGGARDPTPDYTQMRSVNRVRGDYTLTTSEAIYAAVSRISNTMAMLPIHLYREHKPVRDDPRERLLSYMPNATMTPFTFQQTMEAFRNTEGNAYALLVPDASETRVAQLDILDAARVTPMRDKDTREMFYSFTLDDGTPCMVHSSHMIVLHHMSANGEKGVRPLDVLRGTLDYNRQIKEFSLNQLEGVNSGVILNIPGTGLSEEKKKTVIDQFLKSYKASGGKLIVLEGGITATTLTQSPVDAKVLDVERVTKNRVATVYNIPPHLLGDYTDTSYSTAEQSKQEYLDLTILPIVKQWEDELNLKLLTWKERMEGYSIQFDVSAMQRADIATMAEKHQKAIRGGWMRPNEVREREGLPPDPEGDVLLVSRDLQPLEQALNENTESEAKNASE